MPEILGRIEAHWGVKGLFKADANQCASEIQTLGEGFAPEDVVKLARDESKELHKCFVWDNDLAADKYRLHQARMLLSNIKITYIKEDKEPKETKVRMFWGNINERGNYKSTPFIISQIEEREQLLDRAKRELKSFREKYKMLNELDEIFEIIDSL